MRSSAEVRRILLEKKQYEKCSKIDDVVVSNLIDFLRPFKECSDFLSSEKRPTIHWVSLWYHKLLCHVGQNEEDTIEIAKLRQQAKLCLKHYFEIQRIHYVATMLHPGYGFTNLASNKIAKIALLL